MLKKIAEWLGSAAIIVYVLGGIAFFLAGPYVVARVIPDQAYRATVFLTGIAFLIGLLALILGIGKKLRPLMGLTLMACSWIVGLGLWVWSVQVVDQTWGLFVLYAANFFLLIGAVAVAFFALLLSGQWSFLWQWVVGGLIILGMRVVGNLYLKSPQEEIDQHSEPGFAATPAVIDKKQPPESSPSKTLPDYLEQAAWEKFQESPIE